MNNRIKLLKTLANTMPTMKTQPTVAPQKPQTNVPAAPKQVMTNDVKKPENPANPANKTEEQKSTENNEQTDNQSTTQQDSIKQSQQPQQKAGAYYFGNLSTAADMLKNKTIAVKFANNDSFFVKEIKASSDIADLVNGDITSIYETVSTKTDSFRISFDKKYNKNEIFAAARILCKKLNNIGFNAVLAKNDNDYFIKCISTEKHNTAKLYSYASNITNGLSMDLSDLMFGKMKKYYFSLSDNGKQDVIIEF
jgi:hypothetical protein